MIVIWIKAEGAASGRRMRRVLLGDRVIQRALGQTWDGLADWCDQHDKKWSASEQGRACTTLWESHRLPKKKNL